MSGYRQSNFDPNAAWGQPGPPMRPYNWVQWTGVAIAVIGAAGCIYYLLGKAGLVPRLLDDAMPWAVLPIIGAALVNSRREPGKPLSPEMARKRLLIILAAVVVAGIAALIAIYLNSKGA
jgi:hypothetical protein